MKSREQNIKEGIRNIIIIMGAIMVILVIVLVVTNLRKPDGSQKDYSSLQTVQDVVEYYGSKYISQDYSDEKGYLIDINVVFKVAPYVEETEEVNREYYEKLLEDIAKVLSYRSYIIIDKEKKLNIKVKCGDGVLREIIINDISDYFTYIESQLSTKKYEEIEEMELNVSSELLNNIIQSGWDSNFEFGEKDSRFNNYEIYLNQGIRVRKIQDKIYNIIFNKRYEGDVVEGVGPSTPIDEIASILGDPTFEDKENEIIGYKTSEFYIFFEDEEISVYRVYSGRISDFFELADEYLVSGYKSKDLLSFMNELTYMWKDYETYEYSGSTVFLSYPHKGVEIKINYDNENGILVYNNVKSDFAQVKRHLENTSYTSKLKIDCMFEAEKRRVSNSRDMIENAEKNSIEGQDAEHGRSYTYNTYPVVDSNGNISSMKFISQDENYPDREINDIIIDYVWDDNTHFVYDKGKERNLSMDMGNGYISEVMEEDYLNNIRNR